MQALDLSKTGTVVTLQIRDNDVVIGTIEIGHGSLRWFPPKGRKPQSYTWPQFATMMNEQRAGVR
jgi:hypothetical protein